MSLQEQLNELYDEGKEHIEYQAQVIKNRHREIPTQLNYLAERMGLSPERILACARITATDRDPWYSVIERMFMFYQYEAILTEKHKGAHPQ